MFYMSLEWGQNYTAINVIHVILNGLWRLDSIKMCHYISCNFQEESMGSVFDEAGYRTWQEISERVIAEVHTILHLWSFISSCIVMWIIFLGFDIHWQCLQKVFILDLFHILLCYSLNTKCIHVLLQWAKSGSHRVIVGSLKQIYFETKVYTSNTWLWP
jgi:hypothetical protein